MKGVKRKLVRKMVLIYADPAGRAEEKCNSTCRVESDFLKTFKPLSFSVIWITISELNRRIQNDKGFISIYGYGS